MTKWDLFQVWKAGSAFNNELCNHINKLKKKNHDYINEYKRTFDRIQYPFMLKMLSKLDIEGNLLKLI